MRHRRQSNYVPWVVNFPNKSRSCARQMARVRRGQTAIVTPATWESQRRTRRNRSSTHFNGRIVGRRLPTHFWAICPAVSICGCRCDARKIDPSILLNARLSPNMYTSSQVRRGCQSTAVVRAPSSLAWNRRCFRIRVGIPNSRSVSSRIDFMRNWQDQINAAGRKKWSSHSAMVPSGSYRNRFCSPSACAVLFSRHYGLRHPRHCGVDLVRRDFLGNANQSVRVDPLHFAVSFCATFAAALRPVISALELSRAAAGPRSASSDEPDRGIVRHRPR